MVTLSDISRIAARYDEALASKLAMLSMEYEQVYRELYATKDEGDTELRRKLAVEESRLETQCAVLKKELGMLAEEGNIDRVINASRGRVRHCKGDSISAADVLKLKNGPVYK